MKTMTEVRTVLSEEITNLRNKKNQPGHTNAVVNAVGKFLMSIKLELEYAKLQGRMPKLLALDDKKGAE